MASFDIEIPKILTHEGGYANNPNDAGGETYRGIARKFNPSWSGWAAIDAKKKTGTIKTNTVFPELETAVKSYYKSAYWDKMYGDQIKDQNIASILFDAKINQSGGFGWMVQRALGNKSYTSGYSPVMGVTFNLSTVSSINAANASTFFSHFKSEREQYYKYQATKGSNSTFLSGWLTRLQDFTYSAATSTTEYVKKNP